VQNEKGRSHDLPFSLNKFLVCAVIAVQQQCRIRLFGRFLPKLRPLSQAAFFAQIPALANCLLYQLSYIRFLLLQHKLQAVSVPVTWAVQAPLMEKMMKYAEYTYCRA
jgi:hypothetical protein